MSQSSGTKYIVAKVVELIKFCFAASLLCFLMIKAPTQASQIVAAAGAFVLGGTGMKSKIGL